VRAKPSANIRAKTWILGIKTLTLRRYSRNQVPSPSLSRHSPALRETTSRLPASSRVSRDYAVTRRRDKMLTADCRIQGHRRTGYTVCQWYRSCCPVLEHVFGHSRRGTAVRDFYWRYPCFLSSSIRVLSIPPELIPSLSSSSLSYCARTISFILSFVSDSTSITLRVSKGSDRSR